MNEQSYLFGVNADKLRYEFSSVSEKKVVKKIVDFTLLNDGAGYNLALLDLLEDGTLCDTTETRNDDMQKVMATVAQIIVHFFTNKPDVYVIFRGSDPRRHRLYSIIISRELNIVLEKFEVFGIISDTLYPFRKNTLFEFYMLKKKS